MAEGKSGGKNAIPPCGRKRIFAEFGATPFLKHCRAWLFYVFEKRLQSVDQKIVMLESLKGFKVYGPVQSTF